MNMASHTVYAVFVGPKYACVSEPHSRRIRFSPAMPMPRAATNTASSAVGPALAGERAVHPGARSAAPSDGGEQHADARADGQNGQSTRNVNVKARYAASVYVKP